MTSIPIPPNTIKCPKDARNGLIKSNVVGDSFTKTCNILSMINPRISSTTLVATISCPVTVFRNSPFDKTCDATPHEDGANAAPTANALMIVFDGDILPTPNPAPNAKTVPHIAKQIARVPVSFNCAISKSIPEFNINPIKPKFPINTIASGYGQKSSTGGPKTIPAMISPTNVGKPM